MRRIIIAEMLLSLVMPRDRAAATAGDLLESSHGPAAFCRAVAGTALGAIFRQMSAALGIRAVAAAIVLTWVFRGVFFAVLNLGGRLIPELAWLGPVLGVTFLLVHPVLIGHIVARWLADRELAAWLTLVLFVGAASLLYWYLFPSLWTIPLAVLPPVSLLPLLVGALLARRKRLRVA